ncbi:MAG: bacteriophage receptor-2C outer rane subunit [Bacteroidetes bacterium]|nr:bacteriophage receptor-2C outer rane subunit [Bacteroidota bacterium]
MKPAITKSVFPLAQKWHLPLIVISALVAYLGTLGHGFVLDDVAVIDQNSFVKQGFKGIPHLLNTFYWQGYWNSNAGLYRPLSLITFAIEYQFSKNNPMIHHFFNVVYYVIICCLLYKVLVKWFVKLDAGIILLITLLFVVHPIHTEVVANIKSRDELLALLFFLLSANAFKAGNTKSILLSSFYFLLSLFAKEGALMLLPVLLIYVHVTSNFKPLQVFKTFAPFFVVSGIWLLIHQYVIQHGPTVITYSYSDNSLIAAHSVIEQKATAFSILARYFVKLIFPYQMSYDYSFNQIPIVGLFSIGALAGIMMLGALVYFCIKFYRKDAFITIAIAFILFPLLLTCNLLFNIGATAADRFLFVSSIGSCMLLVYLPYLLIKNVEQRSLIKYCVVVFSAVFIIMTINRNKVWKSDFTLFESDVTVSENSARTHYNYGTGLMNRSKDPADKTMADAKNELTAAVTIDPGYYDALINLGAVHTKQKAYPEALAVYRQALKLSPESSLLAGNMGEAFYRNNQMDSAILYFNNAHRLGNHNLESYNILGTIYFTKKDYVQACKVFEEGITTTKDSTSSNLYMNYGNALAMSNRDPEAIKALERSYELNSKNPQALYFIAITYNKMGDTLNANKYYREFKQLNP